MLVLQLLRPWVWEIWRNANIFPYRVHELSGFGKSFSQRGGQEIPAAEDLLGLLPG